MLRSRGGKGSMKCRILCKQWPKDDACFYIVMLKWEQVATLCRVQLWSIESIVTGSFRCMLVTGEGNLEGTFLLDPIESIQ
jgi:hypothetical protein